MQDVNKSVKSRMERKKGETRQKIINVSLALFNRQGYHNTTMEQIAAEADVARKTLYNYYPVKEAIADDYVRGISLGLAEECRSEIAVMTRVQDRLHYAMMRVYGWVAEHPELAEAAFYYRMKNEGRVQEETGTQMISKEILRQGQAEGVIRADLDPEEMACYLNMLRGAALMRWLRQPDEQPLADMVAAALDIFLFGVSSNQGRRQSDI